MAAEDVVLNEHLEEGEQVSEEQLKEAHKVHLPVMIAKVDCVMHAELCKKQQIMGYPTLRLFVGGVARSDYRGDREVIEMTHWLAQMEEHEYGEKGVIHDTHDGTFIDTNHILVLSFK